MARSANIDVILHREGADCMVHSARTEKHIALAPNTAHVNLQPLVEGRDRITESLRGGPRLVPNDLRTIGDRLADVLFAGGVRQVYDGAANDGLLQLSLCACDPKLKSIPWEFVTWPDLKTAPHDKRSICRLVECTTTKPLPPLKLEAGVRIMLVVSQPVDAPAVEWIETQRILETQLMADVTPAFHPAATRD